MTGPLLLGRSAWQNHHEVIWCRYQIDIKWHSSILKVLWPTAPQWFSWCLAGSNHEGKVHIILAFLASQRMLGTCRNHVIRISWECKRSIQTHVGAMLGLGCFPGWQWKNMWIDHRWIRARLAMQVPQLLDMGFLCVYDSTCQQTHDPTWKTAR